jgi:catalase
MDSLAADMEPVAVMIQKRQLAHFYKADPQWGRGVARRLGVDIETAVSEDLLALNDETVAQADVVAELFK